MLAPSWSDYATHDDSAYPELWEGCIGAWCPALGPTGTKLFDFSGLGQNAPAYNLSVDSVWTKYQGVLSAHCDTDGYWLVDLAREVIFPYSMAIIFATDEVTTDHSAVFLSNKTDDKCSGISLRGAQTGDKVWAQTVGSASTWAASSGSYVASVPTLAYGQWLSTASRSVGLGVDNLSEDTTSSSVVTHPIQIGLCAIIRQAASNYYSNFGLIEARLYSRPLSTEERALLQSPGIAYTPRRRRRFYSIPSAAFLAAWARNRSAQILGGGLR